MLDPVRAKARAISVTAISFLGGILLASGMQWTATSHASFLQTAPSARDIQQLSDLGESFIAIAESVTPAVVAISTERIATVRATIPDDVPEQFRRFFENPPDVPIAAGGTGFIISEDGYIITNNHVVADAVRIDVVTTDRREYPAEVIGRDPTTDVAVIKIAARNLPVVRFGDPGETRVGEWVLAIGNPLGLDFTVTAGIVSAKNRRVDIIQQSLLNENEDLARLAVESFIQTDAAINPGNSGGPLVNIRGEVIGVNTAIASESGLSQGYGFAVPIDLARHVADDLIRYGRWRRPVLGIAIADVEVEDVEVFKLPAVAGVVVQDFSQPNTSAEREGMQRGDVIVAVDGQAVTRSNELQRIIASRRPGDRVNVEVIRYGERRSLQIQLVEAATQAPPPVTPAVPQQAATDASGRFGAVVSSLTPELASEFGFRGVNGIVIESVPRTSQNYRRLVGFQGFRILEADGEAITTVQQFERLIDQKPANSVVSLVIEHSTGTRRILNVRLRG